MGFMRRLLGLEVRPGEPQPLTDGAFERDVARTDRPCFIYFFNLWCASCQVLGGLLNEVGPDYADRAAFFKLDTNKNPGVPARFRVTGVPTVILLRGSEEADRLVGLVPVDELREWIEFSLGGGEEAQDVRAEQEDPTSD